MSLILTIDTATEQASVALSLRGKLIADRRNGDQKDHAAWIHVAIAELLREGGIKPAGLNAVSVVAGPGSYTGLRVGMATAKGFCYALNIPMITLNTLKILAFSAKDQAANGMLICPMLDARRMEVYTALYTTNLDELLSPCAMILGNNSFSEWLADYKILFLGSGSNKWKHLAGSNYPDAFFSNLFYAPDHIATCSWRQYEENNFSDLAYAEPIYLKEFYTHHKKLPS
jgi:tRNA threonylcarbamoyladenosine biosynthesis protein TsaB